MSGRQHLSASRVATIIIVGALSAANITSTHADNATDCNGGPAISLDQQIAGCTSFIAQSPNNAVAFLNRGNAYYQKNQYDLAIADDNRAIQLKPDYADAFDGRGNAYDDKGRHDLAIADYTRAIQLKPDYADALYNRGLCYRRKGQYDLAIADYTRTIQIKPDYAGAFVNRGVAYQHKAQYDLAIADYNRAIQIKPDYADAFNNRGGAYDNKGQYDLAIADFQQALKLDPNVKNATDNLRIAQEAKAKAAAAQQAKAQTNASNQPLADGFYLVSEEASRPSAETVAIPSSDPNSPTVTLSRQPVVPGGAIASAEAAQDAVGRTVISIVLTKSGGELMSAATLKNIGRRMAIVSNGTVVSVPTIRSSITDKVTVSGAWTLSEATAIASRLQASGLAARDAKATEH